MIDVVRLLREAHVTFLDALDGLPESDWVQPNVCGAWSCRDTLAHLASYELLLIELLEQLPRPRTTMPLADLFCDDRTGFNSAEIVHRSTWPLDTIYAEYEKAHQLVCEHASSAHLFSEVTHRGLRRYGASYADLVLHIGYGHKLTHAAYIAAFRSRALQE